MYLHIGNNKNIREKHIIGIFDIESSTISNVTRKYLSSAEKKGEVESSTEELPKSFVLTTQYGFSRVYLTSLNTVTLEKRMK